MEVGKFNRYFWERYDKEIIDKLVEMEARDRKLREEGQAQVAVIGDELVIR